MSDFLTLSALEIAERLREGSLTSVEVVEACFARIDAFDDKVHAFVHLDRDGALATAREVDRARAAGETLHPLAGVPIALKDNMVTRGKDTTCCSRILSGWKPPYDATVTAKIKQAQLPILGKTNMDEFAMGSSTEHSCYGPTHNPWDLERIPGGSGGGSAAAVAAFMVPFALGSDTGGSIRQPGAVTGTVGVKPTYGGVSRYGLVAMASSLDQIGPVTRTVADAAALHELIGGHDPFDSTSLDEPVPPLSESVSSAQVAGMTLGVVKQASGEGFDPEVTRLFNRTVEQLREAGATIVEIDCPSFEYALAAYYLIMPAEVSSNLARFDGIRYGARFTPEQGPITAETVMAYTREKGFGDEAKRRLILGTHVLSAGYYDAYYGSAQKVRTLVQRDLDKAFAQVDALVLPTSPTTAFRLGERTDDPMAMYMCDIATIPANLAGIPAMSQPVGCSSTDGMPVGFQIMAAQRDDATMYRVAAVVEELSDNVVAACPAATWKGE